MRTIKLKLKDFNPIPSALLDASNNPLDEINVPLINLSHHYWLSKYGKSFNQQCEYFLFLESSCDWRFQNSGIGIDTEAKRNVSNELGKAFARWFTYEFLGYTYFCPFEKAIKMSKGKHHIWSRRSKGDTPDYVCGPNKNGINLLEAKGRYNSVSFKNKEFQSFRDQLERALLTDSHGVEIGVKGVISASRWGVSDNPRIFSTLWVEDPWTRGERRDFYPESVGHDMVFGHYNIILDKLNLPINLPLAKLTRVNLWECNSGKLAGKMFVGGVVINQVMTDDLQFKRNRVGNKPLLNSYSLVFYGLEFQTYLNILKGDIEELNLNPTQLIANEELGEENISFLRDGSVMGDADYFDFLDKAFID